MNNNKPRIEKLVKHRANLDSEEIVEQISKSNLHQSYISSMSEVDPITILDQKIGREIERNRPDMKKLLNLMKQRRVEQTTEYDEKSKRECAKMKLLSSNSHAGKITEQNICKRFNRTSVEKDSDTKRATHASIEKITESLAKDAQTIFKKWRSERVHEE